jgi:hypothetical protein
MTLAGSMIDLLEGKFLDQLRAIDKADKPKPQPKKKALPSKPKLKKKANKAETEAARLAKEMEKTLEKEKPSPEPQQWIERPKTTLKKVKAIANEYGYDFSKDSRGDYAYWRVEDYRDGMMSLYSQVIEDTSNPRITRYDLDEWEKMIQNHIIENAFERWYNLETLPENFPKQWKLPKFRALYYKHINLPDPSLKKHDPKAKQVKFKDGQAKIPVYGKPLPGIDLLAEYNWLLKNLFDGVIHHHPKEMYWDRSRTKSGQCKVSFEFRKLASAKIMINNALKMSLSTARCVIAHEMLHLFDFQENGIEGGKGDPTGHGYFFKKWMNTLNKRIASRKLPIDPIQPTDTTADIREYLPTGNEKPRVFLHIHDHRKNKDYIGNVYSKDKAMYKDSISNNLEYLIKAIVRQVPNFSIVAYESDYPELGRYGIKRSFRNLTYNPITTSNLKKLIDNSKEIYAIRKG